MKLKLTANDRSPHSVRVWLDGSEITSSLRSLRIDFDHDSLNEAVLVIAPDELEVDADVIAMLQAHVDASLTDALYRR